ncbi:MAG TPA: hypothetical protein VLM75_03295 [Spirochaetota bacterium]|nr:hypothetical protein [Spirochaetota bacterium]
MYAGNCATYATAVVVNAVVFRVLKRGVFRGWRYTYPDAVITDGDGVFLMILCVRIIAGGHRSVLVHVGAITMVVSVRRSPKGQEKKRN